jgi:FkbM family methyltransferase
VNLKRKLGNLIGDAFGVRIARKGKVGPLLEEDCLERFLRFFGIDCVFDVGANEGQYALLLRRLNFDGAIVSFEPIPEAAEGLKRMAAGDKKWFVEQVALDSSVRPSKFCVMKNSEFSSLHEPADEQLDVFVDSNRVTREIRLTTGVLDFYYEKYEKLLGFSRPYLKMDTQGHDLSVARGGERCLQKFIGLQSELAFRKLYANAADYREALDYYMSIGFTLAALVPNNAGHFPNLVEMDCIMYRRSADIGAHPT